MGTFLTLLLAAGATAETRGEHEIPRTGEPVRLGSGEIHFRELDLEAGELVTMVVDQRGVDVVLRLLDSSGRVLHAADSPTGTDGYEDLLGIVPEAGRYRLEVAGPRREGREGHYVLATLEHRPATADGRAAVDADRALREGWARLRKREDEAAIEACRRALVTFRRLGPRRREIEALRRLCVAYDRRNDLPVAMAFCDQALELLRARDDRRGLDTLADLAGIVRLRRGQPERAIPLFEEALGLYEERGSERGVALALSHLGAAHHRLGRTRDALDAFERALAVAPARDDAIRIDYGHVLLDFHRPRQALEQYSRVLETLGRRPEALEGQANAALKLGDLETAESSIREALELAGEGARRSVYLETLGAVLEGRKDAEGARRAFEEAVELARRSGNRHSEATGLTRLGRLSVAHGRPEVGLRLLDEAAEILRQLNVPREKAANRVRSAEALRELGRLDEAWRRIEPALDEVESLRRGTDRRDLRLGAYTHHQEHYEVAIDVLLGLHARSPEDGHAARAFEVHERRLARELRDTLAARTAPLGQADPALVEEERRILRELSAASLAAGGRQAEIDRLLARLDALEGQIRRSVMETAAPIRPRTLDAGEVRRSLLDADTLLLAYALGERRSHVWTLSRRSLTVRELPPRSRLEETAEAFSGRAARADARSVRETARLGRELSNLLLAPVQAELDRHTRLVLITEGALQAIPFAALPRPGTAAADAYLVRSHEIVALLSASALAAQQQTAEDRTGRRRPRPGIALFADAVYSRDDPRLGGTGGLDASARSLESFDRDLERAAESLGLDRFGTLPNTRREAERIRDLFPSAESRLAVGFAARREALFSSDLRSYAVLHFAAHAFVHPEQPELSGLVLSLYGADGSPQNGYVRAFEIARLELAAELVVLSACRTGVGRNLRGEGLQSLARSFLDAGAARVIFSLWEVSDEHTAELMTRFYEALATEASPAAALRKAQAASLDEPGATPSRWAAFVLVGDWHGHDLLRRRD